MNKTLTAVAILCAGSLGVAAANGVSEPVGEARGLVKEFATNLKGKLKAAIEEGGPANAIEVCHTEAPGIAEDVSQRSGWEVARTSLKLRNTQNRPDAWEQQVLESFEARKAAGEDAAKMEHSEIVEVNGNKTFRYMKAIPTAKVCLNCHGAEVKPAVAAKLDELYPSDKARGFEVGDIRGAFTLSKPL